MGDFFGIYTDSQGQQTEIAYNECLQQGYLDDFIDSHAGRGAPEYCTLHPNEREGVEFTVAMQTFAAPLDDGKLDFVAAVVGASCTSLGITNQNLPEAAECVYEGEKFQGDESDEDYAITDLGLEEAFCVGQPSPYCCEYDGQYPDLCGEAPDTAFCARFKTIPKK